MSVDTPTNPARAGQPIPNEIEQAIRDYGKAVRKHARAMSDDDWDTTYDDKDAAHDSLIAAIAAAIAEARGDDQPDAKKENATMTMRDEIEQAVNDLADNAHAIGWNHGHADEMQRHIDRVLALIAPTPAPGDVTDAEIEAGAMVISGNWDDALELSREVLTAARAARATGASE